jgi:hypothetical protein
MGRWQNLTETPYEITFNSSESKDRKYPTAMIRASISGISSPSEMSFTLNGMPMDLSTGFPDTPEWRGSRDRRWIEIQVGESTITTGRNVIQVHLTNEGNKTLEPQGGKMITSVEVIQYGEADRYVKNMYPLADHSFNGDLDFVGAFPTFDDHKRMSLRPVSPLNLR